VEECGPCPVFASFTLTFALQLRKKAVQLRKKRTTEKKVFKNRELERGFSLHISISSCHILDTHLEKTAGKKNGPFETALPRTGKTKKKFLFSGHTWGQLLLRQISSDSSKIRLLLDILQQVSHPHKAKEDAAPFRRTRPQGVLATTLN
jgi:hypothetical protein